MHSKKDPKIRRTTVQPSPLRPQPPISMTSTAYLDTVPALRANAPLGCPHILDLSRLNTTNSHKGHQIAGLIPDLIATILYKHSSCTLTGFLDLSKNFRFHIMKPSRQADFVIVREGRIVTCGIHRLGKWKEQHVYRVGADASEKWTPVSCSWKDNWKEHIAEYILCQGKEFVSECPQRRKWLFEEDGMVDRVWTPGMVKGAVNAQVLMQWDIFRTVVEAKCSDNKSLI